MEELLTLIENQPNNINARLELVKKYLDNNDYNRAKILLEEIIKIDSNNFDANYILGQVYEFDEEFLKAVECFEKVVKAQPNPDLKYKLAGLYENADKYEKALAIYNECYSQNTSDNDICEKIAHVNRILGNNEKAVEFYSKLLKSDPNNIVALTQLAELYEDTDKLLCYVTRARVNEQEGALSHALSCYKKALAEADNPQDVMYVRLSIAEIFVKQENYLKAIDEYLAILEHDNKNYKVYKNLANAYIQLDNPEAAADAYEKAYEIYPEDTDILKELADIYIEIEASEKAFNLLEKIISMEPNNLSMRVNLAKSCISKEMDSRALDELNLVLGKDPKNVEAIGVLVDYYIIKKDNEKALEYTKEIKKYIPKSPFGYKKAGEIYEVLGDSFASHYNFGVYHELKGEKQLAIDEFTWALEKSPDNMDILIKIAALYEDISEDYIAAEYYQKAYRVDNTNIAALKKMNDIFWRKKDYKQVIDICNEILKANGKDKDTLLKLAESYDQSKNYDLAIQNYKEYLNISPLSVKTDQIKERLEKLEGKINGDGEEGLLEKIFSFFAKK
ncbi:MAG: tetratricopeptide repeat protein [Candidatus Gastranaerophilales bacterium]|nr:tetratricopeptide repeat protein [Candidatus Gastranaerophilales bacterium]